MRLERGVAGPVGPQGPQGVAGSSGPTDPQGPSGGTLAPVVTWFSDTVFVGAFEIADLYLSSPANSMLVGTGCGLGQGQYASEYNNVAYAKTYSACSYDPNTQQPCTKADAVVTSPSAVLQDKATAKELATSDQSKNVNADRSTPGAAGQPAPSVTHKR